MTVVSVILLAAAMAVVGVGTSYFWLRLCRIPSAVAAVLAPAVTITLVLGLGYIYFALGIFWSGVRVLPVLFVVGLSGAILYFRKARPASKPLPKMFWVSVAAGWLLAVLPQILAAPLTNPVQQWDPTVHMNAVWSITDIGSGKYGSALPDNYLIAGTSYPLGWHIYTALFATRLTVVLAANASTFALTLLWVVGAGVYTKVLFPRAALFAPIIAGGMLSMPGDALNAWSQWPNAASVALMPGLAALAILLGRKLLETEILGTRRSRRALAPAPDVAVTEPDATATDTTVEEIPPTPSLQPSLQTKSSWGIIVLWLAVLGFGLIGGLMTHMTLAFNLVLLLAAPFVAGLWKLARNRTYIGAAALAAAAVLVVYWAMMTPEVRNMGNYPRSGIDYGVASLRFFLPSPPYGNGVDLQVWLAIILLLMGVGIFAAFTVPGLRRWPVFSFLCFAFITFMTFAPNSAFRSFVTAPWYLDSRRIMAPETLAMVPLIALGLSWLAVRLAPYVRASGVVLTVGVLVASMGAAFPTRLAQAKSVYDGDNLGKPGMATTGELAMLYELRDLLPEDALVLGDPQAGAAYVQALGDHRAYLPQLNLGNRQSPEQVILVNQFNTILTNPRVCEALQTEGITHYYQDVDGAYYGYPRSKRTPGLYNVDTSEGFELIAEGDTARVYLITACD